MTKKRLLIAVPLVALGVALIVGIALFTSTKAEATGSPCCTGCPSCYTDLHNIDCCDVHTGFTNPVGGTGWVPCHTECYDNCYHASCDTECCAALGMWDTGTTPRPGIIWY